VTTASASARRARTGTSPRRSRSRLTPRAAVLLAIVVVMAVYSMVPLRIFLQERADLRGLQRQERALEQRNASLQQQARRLQDPASIELIARQCLGMVRPGQIAFVVVSKGAPPAPPAC
jgi:cell division protein FtsL